jgi:hypothetical protein
MHWTRFGGCAASLLVTAVLLTAASGCRDPARYEPFREPGDAQINALVKQLETAVNARRPAAICALYRYPSPICVRIWGARLNRLRIPIKLRVRYIEGSCNGAPRATLTTHLARDRINTVTWVHGGDGIVEVGVGTRRSSLVIPRYGSCADIHGFGGDPACDIAAAVGYEDEFNECESSARDYRASRK